MSPEPVRLEVVAGRAEGMMIAVEDELVIGRQADGAGRLGEDEEISRTHARVTLDASGFCAIEDLGSTNGTFVNGLRISAPTTLFDGDTIELGGTTLVVRSLARTPADEAQPPAQEEAEPSLAQEETPPPAPEPAPAPEPQGPLAAEPDATIVPGATPGPPREEALTQFGVAPPPTEAVGVAAPAEHHAQASLQLSVDFDSRELTITLAGSDQPLRLVYDGQRWRPGAAAG